MTAKHLKTCWNCTKGMCNRCTGKRLIPHNGHAPCECECKKTK